jgi:hypothetical protein
MPIQTRDEVVSKTARASAVQSTGPKKIQTDPGIRRLVPLNGGEHVYLRDPVTGRSPKFRVGSEEFINAMAALGDQWRPQLLTELKELGWSEAYDALEPR